MTVIVCIDDRKGMMFNGRRQSRDRCLLEDIVKNLDGAFYISEYSRSLFAPLGAAFNATDSFLDMAGKSDICFVENRSLSPYISKIDRLIIYRWNRSYPGDLYLDIAPKDLRLRLLDTYDFAGSSHEKITKEIYVK